jgi:hypothetical protein
MVFSSKWSHPNRVLPFCTIFSHPRVFRPFVFLAIYVVVPFLVRALPPFRAVEGATVPSLRDSIRFSPVDPATYVAG